MPDAAALRAAASPARFAAALTALAAAAGAALALAARAHPMAPAAALAALLGAFAGFAALGVPGLIATGLALCAFLLMKRFDEGLALPLGIYDLQLMYLLAAAGATALALYAAAQRRQTLPAPGAPAALARMRRCLAAFLALALYGIVWNRIAPDEAIPYRNAAGELAALGLILIPAAFGLLLPASNLSRPRTLLCLRALVALGGMAGLIMAAFGLLPQSLVNLLGWTGATGGTVDLVRGRLPLGHANSVAAVIMLLTPAALIMGLRDPLLRWRLLGLAAAALMFCGVLFSLSRSALLCLILAAAAAFAYHIAVSDRRQRRSAYAMLAIAATVAAALALYLAAAFDFSRFWSRRYHEEASTQRRISSFQTGLAVWAHNPVLGAGPNSVFPRLELRPGWIPPLRDEISPIFLYRGHRSAENPHNLYASTLAEFGLLGFMLFFAPIVTALRFLWRARPPALEDPAARDLLAAAVLSTGAFLLMGLFEAVLMTGIRVNLVFWIFLGLALRLAVLQPPRSADPAP